MPDNIEEQAEESYNRFRDTWDLDNLTIAEIYKAGYRHAKEDASPEEETHL